MQYANTLSPRLTHTCFHLKYDYYFKANLSDDCSLNKNFSVQHGFSDFTITNKDLFQLFSVQHKRFLNMPDPNQTTSNNSWIIKNIKHPFLREF